MKSGALRTFGELKPSHSPQASAWGSGRVLISATISMVFELILTKEVLTKMGYLLVDMFGRALLEKPLKWLAVDAGAADPQPEGWGE